MSRLGVKTFSLSLFLCEPRLVVLFINFASALGRRRRIVNSKERFFKVIPSACEVTKSPSPLAAYTS